MQKDKMNWLINLLDKLFAKNKVFYLSGKRKKNG